jgi:hypothetical protein
MNDESTPGLPDDWQPPEQVVLERGWARHPRHDELTRLVNERDEDGKKTWETVRGPHPEHPGWTVLWFRPIDPTDTRESIKIIEYPNKWIGDEYARVRAIIEEQHLD